MRIDIIFYLLFIASIISCNSIDENSNLLDENNYSDSTNNNNKDCKTCIYSYDFEIVTLGVGPEGEIVDDPKVPAALKNKLNLFF